MNENNIFSAPLDEESLNLFIEYRRTIFRQLLDSASRGEAPGEALNEHVSSLCDIFKLVVASDRNAALKQVAQIRAEAAVKTVQARRDRASNKLPGELDDPILERAAAPRGRDDAGRPYTESEFHTSLSRSVKEIYGIDFDAAEVAKSAHPGYVHPAPRNEKDPDPSAAPAPARSRPAPT